MGIVSAMVNRTPGGAEVFRTVSFFIRDDKLGSRQLCTSYRDFDIGRGGIRVQRAGFEGEPR